MIYDVIFELYHIKVKKISILLTVLVTGTVYQKLLVGVLKMHVAFMEVNLNDSNPG